MSGPTGPTAVPEPGWLATARAEAVDICRDLIRIDTTNTGDDDGPGERAAAEYVMARLAEAGYEAEYVESAPRRGSAIFRVEGADGALPPLVVHGHLDVVPAAATDWTVPPFAGELVDGVIWGRGAVDMKDMDAMVIALLRAMRAGGWRPRRDLVVAFLADEEAGGRLGSHWLREHRPGLFAGATTAIGEVGGYSAMVAGRRAYLLQTAEKGLMWLRLVAQGTAGHGSASNPDNAVAHLVDALARVRQLAWPQRLTPTVHRLLAGVAELTGLPFDPDDPATWEALTDALGPARRFVAPSLGAAANLTGLSAGYKVNVVPQTASATVDIRPLPGDETQAKAALDAALGDKVAVDPINVDIGVEAPARGDIVDAMEAALLAADPGAAVLPYMLPAGTDAKSLSQLGIDCYGFVPLKLPADFDFTAMFHGVDERVPAASLEWGVGVLADFLQRY